MNKCLVCNGKDLDTIYNGQIRAGSFKKLTSELLLVLLIVTS